MSLSIDLSDDVVEAIAVRVAALLAERAPAATSRWLSVTEAADLLGVDHKTIRAAIRTGRLPVVQLGRTQRILESDLAQHLGSAGAPARARPAQLRAVRPSGEFTQRAKGTR